MFRTGFDEHQNHVSIAKLEIDSQHLRSVTINLKYLSHNYLTKKSNEKFEKCILM